MFQGYDPVRYFEDASEYRRRYRSIEKDEFETQRQFSDRRDSLVSGPIFDSLEVNDYVVFRVDPLKSLEYDAENQRFVIITRPYQCVNTVIKGLISSGDISWARAQLNLYRNAMGQLDLSCGNSVINLGRTESERRTGKKENIFHYQKTDGYFQQKAIGVAVVNVVHKSHERLTLHMPPGEARRVKNDLGLLLVMQPEYPFADYIQNYPLARSGVDRFVDMKLIYGRLYGFWIYNIKSGDVYKKELFDHDGPLLDGGGPLIYEEDFIDDGDGPLIYEEDFIDYVQ